jgi:hypothetical protein
MSKAVSSEACNPASPTKKQQTTTRDWLTCPGDKKDGGVAEYLRHAIQEVNFTVL